MNEPTEQSSSLQDRILQHVKAASYQPVKPRLIAKQLGLPDDQQRDVRRAVKKLVKRGKLAYGPKHRVLAATAPDPSLITGIFRRASGGYGFVRPEQQPGAEVNREHDIYVSHRNSKDASTGDLVNVRLKRRREPDDPRRRGAIVEVVRRESNRFVGVYRERNGTGTVQVDGNLFAQPILVGDPGAKNARENDKVVIEMVRFPAHVHAGEGVIVEVLGARGEPGIDTLSIIHEFNLPGEFPEDAMQVAREQAAAFDESIGEDRQDLTAVTTITIDPIDARDFDDAISLERLENGHWRLGVHIADVVAFVPERSALDAEARKRATSVYLPDRVIPMLPEIISNNLASLQPDRVRYARTAWIEMTPDGARVACDVQRSAIRSDRRFSYEEVDEFLEDREAWKDKLEPDVYRLLDEMHTLAMVLRQRRLTGGAIELHLPEIKLNLDPEGRVAGAHLVKNTESHQIIEEFMLSANEAVAESLHDRELLFLRRVHGQPNPRKLIALTEFVQQLGIPCESLESRFEIKRVLELARGKPQEQAVHFATLRSMQKAVYGPQVEGHYALHSDHYCHFTSPIRRYPDLTVHRIFDALAAGKRPPQNFNELAGLGSHCSEREQRAEAAERELIKIKLLAFLSDQVGKEMEAVVTGVETYGLFVQLAHLPAEGLVHVSSMQDDRYHYDEKTRSLIGNREANQYRLGDKVKVEVTRIDIDRRELDFRIAGMESSRGSSQAGSRGRRSDAANRGKRPAGKPGRSSGRTSGKPGGASGKPGRPAPGKRGAKKKKRR